ncbi:hypothetical protein LOZ58_003040 [Ophidiomyces ophidiicola]|nr:hypothetical protein LOZ58_003040 [Ophidiomyces ophidiicola]
MNRTRQSTDSDWVRGGYSTAYSVTQHLVPQGEASRMFPTDTKIERNSDICQNPNYSRSNRCRSLWAKLKKPKSEDGRMEEEAFATPNKTTPRRATVGANLVWDSQQQMWLFAKENLAVADAVRKEPRGSLSLSSTSTVSYAEEDLLFAQLPGHYTLSSIYNCINHDQALPAYDPVEHADDVGRRTSADGHPQVAFKNMTANPTEISGRSSQTSLFEDPELFVNGDSSIKNIQNGIKEGLGHLQKLKEIYTRYAGKTWLREIEEIEKKSNIYKRHVIGLFGETGAGKSSLINALLDEERIVPPNGMRASTATVVEIAYNHCSTPYRAEVEFITREEWAAYLRVLFGDISDQMSENKLRNDKNNESTIALAMIKAVYGTGYQNTENFNIDDFLTHERVVDILGQVKSFEQNDPDKFYREIQQYIDSKDRNLASSSDMEYWPLIRVVRVYVKSSILKTGAVIADLPGIQDSNPARAEVANKYLKECSSIWVLAPVVRAVDNKTARNLMGDCFKRQLQMDGSLHFVSVICTKTDDISFVEFAQTAAISQLHGETRDAIQNLRANFVSLRARERELEATKADVKGNFEIVDAELDSLLEQVTSPRAGPDTADLLVQASQMRSQLKGQVTDLERDIANIEGQVALAMGDIDGLNSIFERECVALRNRTVKACVKVDFAGGIQDLDLQGQKTEPEGPLTRDYQSLADSLPVFCVSSRSYQQLQGRMTQGRQVIKGFQTSDETEIPQLQAHCADSTLPGRRERGLEFLDHLERLFNSLNFGLRADETSALEIKKRIKDQRWFAEKSADLERHYERQIAEFGDALHQIIEIAVCGKLASAASRAERMALVVLEGWGDQLAWNTFKAICRRNGKYTRDTQTFNLNYDLCEPLLTALQNGWEKAFTEDFAATLTRLVKNCNRITSLFYQAAEANLVVLASNEKQRKRFQAQLKRYKNMFAHIHSSLHGMVRIEQQNASRIIEPTVRSALTPAYSIASQYIGDGCYRRMRNVVGRQIAENIPTMFASAQDEVMAVVRRLSAKLEKKGTKCVEEIRNMVIQDFTRILEDNPSAYDMNREVQEVLENITMFKDEVTPMEED